MRLLEDAKNFSDSSRLHLAHLVKSIWNKLAKLGLLPCLSHLILAFRDGVDLPRRSVMPRPVLRTACWWLLVDPDRESIRITADGAGMFHGSSFFSLTKILGARARNRTQP